MPIGKSLTPEERYQRLRKENQNRKRSRQTRLNARAEPDESVRVLIDNKGDTLKNPELIDRKQGTEVIKEMLKLVEDDEPG